MTFIGASKSKGLSTLLAESGPGGDLEWVPLTYSCRPCCPPTASCIDCSNISTAQMLFRPKSRAGSSLPAAFPTWDLFCTAETRGVGSQVKFIMDDSGAVRLEWNIDAREALPAPLASEDLIRYAPQMSCTQCLTILLARNLLVWRRCLMCCRVEDMLMVYTQCVARQSYTCATKPLDALMYG